MPSATAVERLAAAVARTATCADALFTVLPSVPSAYGPIRAAAHRAFALLPALVEVEWFAARGGAAEAIDFFDIVAEQLLELAAVCRDCAGSLSLTSATLILRHSAATQDIIEKLDWAMSRLGWTGVSRMPLPARGYGARRRYSDSCATAAETAARVAATPERVKLLCVVSEAGGGGGAFAKAVAEGLLQNGHVDSTHAVRWAGPENTAARIMSQRGRFGPGGSHLSHAYNHSFENSRVCVVVTGLSEKLFPAALVSAPPQAPALQTRDPSSITESTLQSLLPSLPPLSHSSRVARVVLIASVTVGAADDEGAASRSVPDSPQPSAAVGCWVCSPPNLSGAACVSIACGDLPELLRSPTGTLQLRADMTRLAEQQWLRQPFLVKAGAAVVRIAADSAGGIGPVVASLLDKGEGKTGDDALAALLGLLPAAPGDLPLCRPDALLTACGVLFAAEPFSVHQVAAGIGLPVVLTANALRRLVAAALVTTDGTEAEWGNTTAWTDSTHQAEWDCQYRLHARTAAFVERRLEPRAAELGVDVEQLMARLVTHQCAEVWMARQEIDFADRAEGVARYLRSVGVTRRAIQAGLFSTEAPPQCRASAVELTLSALRLEEQHLSAFSPTSVAVALAIARALQPLEPAVVERSPAGRARGGGSGSDGGGGGGVGSCQ
eukprot:TRINITY_DN11735_c0_g1_i12.p1 TRINITY_DN11735_c0_g1~~TRINITY_DN11735_c0_g1_i12.p1  ORF type:complete len:667 (+),score=174.62 TRINITY_DN11735_c0_g1_i12:69-2069(+)